jgi:hypothetical protein
MKMPKGKLNPGFVLIVFSLLTGSHLFAQNLLKNPGFETGELSPFWGTWPAGSNSSVGIETSHVYTGNFCATISSQEGYLFQPVNLEPNTTYKISATIKTEAGDVVYFGVKNIWGTTGVSVVFTATDFSTDSLVFTTGDEPGDNQEIYIRKGSGAGGAWMDDLKLTAETTGRLADEPGGAGVYYVSPTGNDSNTGTSPQDAWQSVEKINRVNFEPGDSVLFEGSQIFFGNIRLNQYDSGSSENPVYFGSFGTGRAEIDAGSGSGLIATDCSYLSIKNLSFKGDGRKTGNRGNGLVFSFCSYVIADSIEVSGFQHSGVTAKHVGQNYRFTRIHAHSNGYAGIFVSGIDKNSLSDIYIGHCIADNNPGDPTVTDNHSGNGIFAYQSKNIIIEYCKASNNGWDMPRTGNGPGGIWVAEVDSAIIQYCISHDNKTSAGGQDGLGFDLDGGITNSVIQYCLSYNNQGAGYGIFQYNGATEWKNNTIRYCISENDGNVSAGANILIWNGSRNKAEFQGLEFHNNVIYNSSKAALVFYDHLNSNFNFRNNIFISKTSSVYNRINGENFQGNCWYTINNNFYLDSLNFIAWAQTAKQEMLNGEIAGIYANPNLINPGNSTLTDPTLLHTVNDYKVHENSAVIDAGLDLDSIFNVNPGNQDFFGNSIKQGPAFDMGVYEFIAPCHVPDTSKPVVTSFFVPETSYSQHIPVIEFSAADNISVTGYKLTETSISPLPGDAGWSATAPASYVFVTAGTKTLYAWAKDAAGNVSASLSDQVIITLPENDLGNTDIYGNTIKWGAQLAMPVTFTELGEITSVSIYHDGGTGNMLLGVYSDQGGFPSSRLGITASTLVSASAGWQTIQLSTPVPVVTGQKVWLSWVFQNTPAIRYTSGTPGRAASSNNWANQMPSAFGTSTIASTKYSIYCTYATQGSQPDVIAPVVTAFSIPATSSTLTVPVSSFTATDNKAVTGYLVTESATAPLAGDAGWSATAPASYVFVTAGTKTLYAWAKDAAGNVSASMNDQVIITLPENDLGNTDIYGNTIKWGAQLAMPVTFTESGEITSVSIYHDGGSGNMLLGVYSDQGGFPSSRLGITASTMVSASAGWQTIQLSTPVPVVTGQKVWLSWVFQTAPVIRYTSGTPGRAASSNNWANQMPSAFGTSNIASTKYSIYCTYTTQGSQPDVIAPVVTAFSIPATSSTLTVPVSSFTATDNKAVTGYLVTESATAPLAGDAGWSATAPASYVFVTAGTKTLYAWAKDAAGNVSA